MLIRVSLGTCVRLIFLSGFTFHIHATICVCFIWNQRYRKGERTNTLPNVMYMDNFQSDIATVSPLCQSKFIFIIIIPSICYTHLYARKNARLNRNTEQSKYSFINRLCKSYYASIVDLSSESIVLKSIKQHDIAITIPTPTHIIAG